VCTIGSSIWCVGAGIVGLKSLAHLLAYSFTHSPTYSLTHW
jgi:hypothetical protein